MLVLAFVFALVIGASPSPSPTPSTPPLKEIGVVNAVSPYCSTFYNHFNAAVRPMLQNDQQLNYVSVSLDTINNDVFTKFDWESRFDAERLKMERYVAVIEKNNAQTQEEVNTLRRAEKATTDPEKAHTMHMLAQEMQRALDKQVEMGFDLHNVIIAMMDYDKTTAKVPIGGVDPLDHEPAATQDMKEVLRFDGMRDRLRSAESMAAGYAETIAEKYC